MAVKKSKESIQIQVGAFLAVGILLFMAAIFMLGSKSSLFQSQYRLVCYFDDISGLRIGAPVQLAGVNAGFIESIAFVDRQVEPKQSSDDLFGNDPKAAPSIPVKGSVQTIVKVMISMKIDTQFKDRIRADSIASVVTQGLLGDRMIYITPGSADKKVLNDGAEIIEVKNPSGFSQLVEKGDALIIETQAFVKNAGAVTEDVDIILKEIIKGDGVLHDVLYNPENKKLLATVYDILYNFNEASKEFVTITSKINDGKGTLGALVNDESLYQDIKMLMGKANRNKLVRSVIRYTLKTKEEEQQKK